MADFKFVYKSGEMKRDSSLRRFIHLGQGEPTPVRCYAQRSPAVARHYEEVRCGRVVRKNCQDVAVYTTGSIHEGTSVNRLESGLAKASTPAPKALETALQC